MTTAPEASTTEAEPTMPFGPYAGRSVREVAVLDPPYLADLVAEGIGPDALLAAAGRALLGRPRARSRVVAACRLRAALRGGVVAWAAAGLIAGVLMVAAVRTWSHRDAALPLALPTVTSTAGPRAASAPRATVPARPTAASPPTAAVDLSAPCGSRAEGAIEADAAADQVGTFQAVEFRVVRTKDTGRVTFLNSHDPYAGHFYVAVFPDDYDRFEAPPERLFSGRCVVVQGTIELYDGTPQIVLRDPDDIRVLGEG